MDYSVAPILAALAGYHLLYRVYPAGTSSGPRRGPADPAAIGEDAFGSDLLATAGLDDRKSSGGYLSRAEELMADAVGAEQAFFSTCGSSLSVKAGWHVRRCSSRVAGICHGTRQAADRG